MPLTTSRSASQCVFEAPRDVSNVVFKKHSGWTEQDSNIQHMSGSFNCSQHIHLAPAVGREECLMQRERHMRRPREGSTSKELKHGVEELAQSHTAGRKQQSQRLHPAIFTVCAGHRRMPFSRRSWALSPHSHCSIHLSVTLSFLLVCPPPVHPTLYLLQARCPDWLCPAGGSPSRLPQFPSLLHRAPGGGGVAAGAQHPQAYFAFFS